MGQVRAAAVADLVAAGLMDPKDEDLYREFAAFKAWQEARKSAPDPIIAPPLPPPSPAPAQPTIGAFWDEYAEWGQHAIKSWKSNQAMHSKTFLRKWRPNPNGPPLGEMPWNVMNANMLQRYRMWRTGHLAKTTKKPIAVGTRNREVCSIKSFYAWLKKTERIPTNPIAGAPDEVDTSQRETTVDLRQLGQLMAHARFSLQLMLLISWEVGMRRGEIQKLRKDQLRDHTIQTPKGPQRIHVLQLVSSSTKARKPRTVPLSDEAHKAIMQGLGWQNPECPWVFANPRTMKTWIPNTTLWDWFNAARKKSGVAGVAEEKVWFHSLRHSYATDLTALGTPWPAVKAGGGWVDDKIAGRYQHVTGAVLHVLREAMAARRGPHTAPLPPEPLPDNVIDVTSRVGKGPSK